MYTKKNGRVTYKTNRRSNFKRNNNVFSKGRNKGNVTQQYNKYLKLAKDTFSSGDKIQAEYYYQFTDHYYRLMLELGISLDEQDLPEEAKTINNDNNFNNDNKETISDTDDKNETEDLSDNQADQSIESVPFISEPVKKKRSRSIK